MAELLKVDVSGLQQWSERVAGMQRRLEDLSPVFDAGDEWVRAEIGRQFETQGTYLQNGVEWAPLSPEYAKRKPEPPAPFGILYLTGRLYESFAQENNDHVKVITKDSGTYGSSVSYGKHPQKGTPKMPQRKIAIARNRLYQLFAKAIAAYSLKGIKPGTRA